MAHACNPSTLGDQGRWITWGQEFETSLANLVKPYLYWKYRNQLGVVACACNPSYSGGWGKRITWTWETEVVVRRDCAIALQPGWQSKTPSQKKRKKKSRFQSGTVESPALWEARAGRSLGPAWATRWDPPSLQKNTKLYWAWCCAPVIPATREAKAEELLEPRRWRLQWAKITTLHSSLGNRARLCLKRKKKKRKLDSNYE